VTYLLIILKFQDFKFSITFNTHNLKTIFIIVSSLLDYLFFNVLYVKTREHLLLEEVQKIVFRKKKSL